MRRIPLSVWRLTIAYSLMMAGTSLMVLLAGIIGADFAPTRGLATLPIALVVVGLALSTLTAMQSLVMGTFAGFCAGAFLMGWAGAAGHQYRFAALEAVSPEAAPRATAFLLLGGILAAFIGPELAVRGRGLMSTEYAGSYLLLALSYVAGIAVISFHRDEGTHRSGQRLSGRPLGDILRSPVVILAVASAAVAYGIMSFIMTATPISMHTHAGHSLDATKFVIQSHIAGMYLPALVYPYLHSHFGFRGMMGLGIAAYVACLGIAILDTAFLNYWLALVLLGIGWNFLFLSGTNLLPRGYRPEERFRVQSMNDFLVFSVQAVVSLSSGWFLYRFQWEGLVFACLPLVFVFTLTLAFLRVPVRA